MSSAFAFDKNGNILFHPIVNPNISTTRITTPRIINIMALVLNP
jgi:hypothetical protein